MKKQIKLFAALFVMTLTFVVMGITAEAQVYGVEQSYASTTGVSIKWTGNSKYYGYQFARDVGFTDVLTTGSTSGTTASQYNLEKGSVYYARVGYGTSYSNCKGNWSAPIKVVTTPDKVSDVFFTGADENSATISWTASAGADKYYIIAGGGGAVVGVSTTNSYRIPLNDNSTWYYYVVAAKTNGSFETKSSTSKSVDVSRLTSKIAKGKFGLYSVLSYSDKMSVIAEFYGTGFETQIENVGGSKKVIQVDTSKGITSKTSCTEYTPYKANKMYKYRVRPYVKLTNGTYQYGQWSDYRVFCEVNGKYTSRGRKINAKWSKINGSGRVIIKVSTKEKSGFKTFKTLKISKKNVTINKCGKSYLKYGKKYYVRIVPQAKINGKYVSSDYYGQINVIAR